MSRRIRFVWAVVSVLAVFGLGSSTVLGGAHTWDVNQIFSNSDGDVQYIMIREANGGSAERGIGGHSITSNSNSFLIPSNLTGDTSNKFVLFATQAFADLPGAPTPDHIIAPNFFSTSGDTISYTPYDSFTFGFGQLPVDGINALNRNFSTGVNSPTNYAGETGTVDASGGTPPPGVPDGTGGATPMTVALAGPGSLMISWDTTTCGDAGGHQILYGEGSQLPALVGAGFGLTGSVCGMGTTSPFLWNAVPAASDGSGLLWWLIVANDGGNQEGSWGKSTGAVERAGPGASGSSAQCGMVDKDLSNGCGQ